MIGSASSPFGCFSCITGRDYPAGDYEIDGAIDKKDADGRVNIKFEDQNWRSQFASSNFKNHHISFLWSHFVTL